MHEPLLHLFVEDGPGTSSNYGAGIDFSQRKGEREIVFGFGADCLHGREGFYLEKDGKATQSGDVAYVTFHDLHVFTGRSR